MRIWAKNIMCFLGERVCKASKPLWGGAYTLFMFCLLLLGFPTYYTTGVLSWVTCSLLLWLCLGISLLNHSLHHDKKNIIEGFIGKESSRYLSYSKQLTSFFILLVNVSLVFVLAVLLWKLSFVDSAFFSSATHEFSDWCIYTVDLVFKAVLFDIPEVYGLNLIEIQHQGFIGGSIVLVMRIAVLVLVVGSVLHWSELRKTIYSCLQILQTYPEIGRTKLLLILEMYPRQLMFVTKQCSDDKYSEITRECLWKILGESLRVEILPFVERELRNTKSQKIRVACLKALEHLKTGDLATVSSFIDQSCERKVIEQACYTLASWNTSQSIDLVKKVLQYDDSDLRCFAIKALSRTDYRLVGDIFSEIAYDSERSKEERFAAKDALIELGKFTVETYEYIVSTLQLSDSPANRRFSAMVLGGVDCIDYLSHLCLASKEDSDADTRFYCIQGMHNLAKWSIAQQEIYLNVWDKAIDRVVEMAGNEKYDLARAESIHTLSTIFDFCEYNSEFVTKLRPLQQVLPEWTKSESAHIMDAVLDVFNKIEKHQQFLGVDFEPQWNLADDYTEMGISVCCTDVYQVNPLFDMKNAINILEEKLQSDSDYKFVKKMAGNNGVEVWLVEDQTHNIQRVYKCATQEDRISQIEKEIQLLDRLQHENLVQKITTHLEVPGFSMPFTTEDTLLTKLEKEGPLKIENVYVIVEQLCNVLQYIHDQNVVYCDLKPKNILFNDGQVTLIDLGGAYCESFNSSPQGTPPYMAPELVSRQNPTVETDIYSLGILVYHMLTGILPGGIALPTTGKCAPTSLSEILAKATAFYPEKRYKSVAKFRKGFAVLWGEFIVNRNKHLASLGKFDGK